jgi:hypothetical protein
MNLGFFYRFGCFPGLLGLGLTPLEVFSATATGVAERSTRTGCQIDRGCMRAGTTSDLHLCPE